MFKGISNLPEYIRKQNEQEREIKLASLKSNRYDAVLEHLNPENKEKNKPWILKIKLVDALLKEKRVKNAIKKIK